MSSIFLPIQSALHVRDYSLILLPNQSTTPMITFGISIGTHRTGICILQDDVLLDREIHSFVTPWSEEKFHAIIKCYRQYLHKYPIWAIMVKVPPERSRTPAINRVIGKIKQLAKEYYCDFDLILKIELKGFTLMRDTNELIEYTRRLYPELAALPDKGLVDGKSNYKKLYEAVLAAHIYQERRRLRGKD